MELHSTQKIVAIDDHDYRVVDCGRQWGKSTLAVLEMIACAYSKSGREVAYFATTFDQARNIAWVMLKNFSNAAWAKQPNESRLELYLRTQDKGESRITLRGFENVETARGQQFDLLVIDELAQMRNWDYSWNAILEPTLAFRKGKALFISTPTGFNHFYELFKKGQTNNQFYKSWQFRSEENPYLPKSRIEQARTTSTPDYFAQEYLADFRKFTGLVHSPWDRSIHLIKPFEIPKEWQYARGYDFGSTDGTASIRCVFDNDWDIFIERCYLDNHKTIKEHAEVLRNQDYSLPFMPAWGDPSGGQWFTDFQYFNINIEKAKKDIPEKRGFVEYGIEKINERLLPQTGRVITLPDNTRINNAPHMFVFDNKENENFVKQIEYLKWKETNAGVTIPVIDDTGDPTGFHYDLLAALRYLLVSWTPQTKDVVNDFSKWSIGESDLENTIQRNDFSKWRI